MDNGGEQGPRLWVVASLVVYLLLVVAVLVLPVSYAQIVTGIGQVLQGWGIGGFGTGWIEFVTNILMFAPLGFLLTLLFRHPWRGVLLALALSVGAELAQILIPSRQASPRDILANVLGAAIGAAFAWIVVRRRHAAGQSEAPDRSDG
ncbi:glycopeptide antibiotics resistance protein [Microbacterium sp. ZKA21]|uniref:VanZ family protein n=1 Tax=Microbacterium sp. ZKA21 TaxID=3381694 RepID=UPI003D1C7058